MREQEYIYRVSFKDPTKPVNPKDDWDKEERTDYFFSSLSAIYGTFSVEQVGCKVSRLWNLKITPNKPYRGRKCVITKEPVASKRRTLKKITKFAQKENVRSNYR